MVNQLNWKEIHFLKIGGDCSLQVWINHSVNSTPDSCLRWTWISWLVSVLTERAESSRGLDGSGCLLGTEVTVTKGRFSAPDWLGCALLCLLSLTCSCFRGVSDHQDSTRKTKPGCSKTQWVGLVCAKVYHWPHHKNKILESHWNLWCGMLIKSITMYKVMAVKGRSENTIYHMLLFSEGFEVYRIVCVCA